MPARSPPAVWRVKKERECRVVWLDAAVRDAIPQLEVLGKQRTGDALLDTGQGTRKPGQRPQVDFGRDARCLQHLNQVPCQAKPRNVSASERSVIAQDLRRSLAGLQHRYYGTVDPSALGERRRRRLSPADPRQRQRRPRLREHSGVKRTASPHRLERILGCRSRCRIRRATPQQLPSSPKRLRGTRLPNRSLSAGRRMRPVPLATRDGPLHRAPRGCVRTWRGPCGCVSEGFRAWPRRCASRAPELARKTGALRKLRKDKSPANLLRTLLLHVGCGHSLRETVVRARREQLADCRTWPCSSA